MAMDPNYYGYNPYMGMDPMYNQMQYQNKQVKDFVFLRTNPLGPEYVKKMYPHLIDANTPLNLGEIKPDSKFFIIKSFNE